MSVFDVSTTRLRVVAVMKMRLEDKSAKKSRQLVLRLLGDDCRTALPRLLVTVAALLLVFPGIDLPVYDVSRLSAWSSAPPTTLSSFRRNRHRHCGGSAGQAARRETFCLSPSLYTRTSTPSPSWEVLFSSSGSGAESETDEQAQQQQQPPSSLLLTADEVAQQMARLRSKYPTSEADYLAAARARSAAKTQSVEGAATDDDFEQLAKQKRQQVGEIDDWEQSKAEAGNSDSQILIPMNIVVEDESGDADEPRLLLF